MKSRKLSDIPTVKVKQVYDIVYNIVSDTVKFYRDDLLVHDQREIINNDKNLPFLHMTRETGTALCMLSLPSQYPEKGEKTPYLFGSVNREELLQSTIDIIKHYARESKIFIFYDGKTVEEITKNKVLEIAKDYEKQIVVGFKQIDYNKENKFVQTSPR